MRLVRFGAPGAERPGLIDGQDRIRDLSGLVLEIDGGFLAGSGLSRMLALTPDEINALPLVDGAVRLGPPVVGTSKIIAIGLNYVDHAHESGMNVPSEPVVFMKATSAITGPADPVELPPDSTHMDWEVEMCAVIGKTAKRVTEEAALAYVAGYCLANDFSERHWQLHRGGQWDKGKSFDTFAPIGPWLLTADEVPDLQDIGLWMDVNGERMQEGSTREMVFGVARLVSYVSQCMTLVPGDLIFTGTPPGVGMGRQPPQFLRAGDQLRFGIDRLGVQTHTVVTAD